MKAIEPNSTIGVLGSGQLGRMFAIAARRMGYRVHTFSPDSDTPTGQVSDREYERPYDDLDAARGAARGRPRRPARRPGHAPAWGAGLRPGVRAALRRPRRGARVRARRRGRHLRVRERA